MINVVFILLSVDVCTFHKVSTVTRLKISVYIHYMQYASKHARTT